MMAEGLLRAGAMVWITGRNGEAEDMQGVVTLLCARGGAFISGAVIPVDGASAVRPMY